jgi:hypothetical protein
VKENEMSDRGYRPTQQAEPPEGIKCGEEVEPEFIADELSGGDWRRCSLEEWKFALWASRGEVGWSMSDEYVILEEGPRGVKVRLGCGHAVWTTRERSAELAAPQSDLEVVNAHFEAKDAKIADLTAELQRVQNDRDDLKLQASALESKLNAVTDERDAALKRIDDFGSMGTVAKHTLIEDSGVAALRTQCDELQARVDSAVARLLRRDELAMLVPMGFTYDLLAILQQGEES